MGVVDGRGTGRGSGGLIWFRGLNHGRCGWLNDRGCRSGFFGARRRMIRLAGSVAVVIDVMMVRFDRAGSGRHYFRRQQRFSAVVAAQLLGHIVVDRTGVGDFLSDLEFVELVDDLARLNFQLSRQLIDSDLTHN